MGYIAAAQKMWEQFITVLVKPRKRDIFVAKSLGRENRYGGPHQSYREKDRRLSQIEKGILKKF